MSTLLDSSYSHSIYIGLNNSSRYSHSAEQ